MIIVTGGAGFIGSAFVWKLNSLGYDDILVVDNLQASEKWRNLVNRRYSGYLHRDEFLERVKSDSLPGGVEAVVHMGACSSTVERDADFLMRNNVEYSKTLCEYALSRGIRYIQASSAATYGDGERGFEDDPSPEALNALRPLNMYGYSKHLFDLWALRNGLLDRIVSLKFFNVYGPNEQHKGGMRSMVNKARQQIRDTGQIRLFKSNCPDYPDGGQLRDFIYVKDCVDIMSWFLDNPAVNGLFNVGTGQARSWNDLAVSVFAALDMPVNIEYVDMPEELRGKYQNFTQADMRRLRLAGYVQPFHSLEQGVNDYVKYYLESRDPYL